jgi:hypothetical protein
MGTFVDCLLNYPLISNSIYDLQLKDGKVKETWRVYRTILAGYHVIKILNFSHLVPILGVCKKNWEKLLLAF